jgi:hypothetical protein
MNPPPIPQTPSTPIREPLPRKYLLIPKSTTVELQLKEEPPGFAESQLPHDGDDDDSCFEEIRDLPFVDMIDESPTRGVAITIFADHPRELQPAGIVARAKAIIDILNRHRERVNAAQQAAREAAHIQRESHDY